MSNYTLDQFDRYPVYGSRVTALIDLLASIAVRITEENTRPGINEDAYDGNK